MTSEETTKIAKTVMKEEKSIPSKKVDNGIKSILGDKYYSTVNYNLLMGALSLNRGFILGIDVPNKLYFKEIDNSLYVCCEIIDEGFVNDCFKFLSKNPNSNEIRDYYSSSSQTEVFELCRMFKKNNGNIFLSNSYRKYNTSMKYVLLVVMPVLE